MKSSVLLLVLLSHFTFSVKHSLKLIYTASSGVPDFPEFSAAAVVDETVVAYCDTKLHIREDWMKNLLDDNPQLLQRFTYECEKVQPQHFRETINNLKQSFNQREGFHIVQRVSGCEWDDETGEVTGFNQYGYNGEDFISFDLETSTWIAKSPQAFSTKLKWDADKKRTIFNKFHLTHLFPEWLKMFVEYGEKSLMRTVPPSVSLLQKSPSSPVTCHATGFFPDRAVMFWTRDGVKLSKEVDHGEILPNHDGSFQMSVGLPEPPPEDRWRYECVFQLHGVKENVTIRHREDTFRTNYDPDAPHDMTFGGAILIIFVSIMMGLIFVLRFRRLFRVSGPPTIIIVERSSELSERLTT